MGNYDHVVVKKILDKDGYLAVIPVKIMSGIKSYTAVTLKYGSYKRTIDVIPALDCGVMLLTEKLINEMHIYDGFEVDIKANGKDTIQIGPLVGIFSKKRVIRKIKEGIPSDKTIKMIKAARSTNCLAYFFSIDSINWLQNYVDGFTYDCSDNKLMQQRFPLPDVLYDRGSGFSNKQSVQAKYIRKQFDSIKELERINTQYCFDKWNLYYTLNQHESIKQYLPDTQAYRELSNLNEMLSKHPTIFLKICDASIGNKIIYVKKINHSTFEYSYFSGRLITGCASSTPEIVHIAREVMHRKPFIIQQGIDAITFENHYVDIHVLVQKDGEGKSGITATLVRIDSNNCPIASTKSGCNVYKFQNAFEQVLHYSSEETSRIKMGIEKFIYIVAEFIERNFGKFGELGIDVALDKQGQLWLIDVTAKPGKDTILKLGDEECIGKAFTLPFEYCRRISGFIDGDNG